MGNDVRVHAMNKLVDRFLSWPLPGDVAVDPCAMALDYPGRTGTNLLTANQACAMLEHVLKGWETSQPEPEYLDGVNVSRLADALVWLGCATDVHESMAASLAHYVNTITDAVLRNK
ncbi:hypothetical protein CKO32_18445, partial [Afifella marina DSM 2698]|nr:hypothetical protein [Afifella marina DSM 2698]